MAVLPSDFAIGAVLGAERERISELTRSWPGFVWFFVAAGGLFLANAEWISPEQPVPGVEAVVTVGATLIVLLVVSCGSAKRLGDTAAAQWLGRVSFSLYLVHLPIILAAVTLLRSVSLPLALAVSVAASFVVAELFYARGTAVPPALDGSGAAPWGAGPAATHPRKVRSSHGR